MITRSRPDAAPLPPTIWYMGVKTRVLDDFLDRVLLEVTPAGGRVLDLFSGTGVVSAFCSRHFQTLANDVQLYSSLLTRSFIEEDPAIGRDWMRDLDPEADLGDVWQANRELLEEHYREELAGERDCLEAFSWSRSESGRGRRDEDAGAIERYREYLRGDRVVLGGHVEGSALPGEESLRAYRRDPRRQPAALLTMYYAHVYFGLRQAIELDSLRAAIFRLEARGDAISRRRALHYLSSLIRTASITTSGTSHFAQPRHLTRDSEVRAMARRRTLDIGETFRNASAELVAYLEAVELVPGCQAIQGDYRELVEETSRGPRYRESARSDVVYMDPPYTGDNYSRFYHVLEVLAAYDYPELQRDARGELSRGRYPLLESRFQSGFSSRARVEGEFAFALEAAARSGSTSIISYSSPSGLLLKSYRDRIPGDPLEHFRSLCGRFYEGVEIEKRSLLHSGQGDRNLEIDELLLVGTRPRV